MLNGESLTHSVTQICRYKAALAAKNMQCKIGKIIMTMILFVFHNFYICIVNFLTLGLNVDRSDYSREYLKLRNHEMRSFNLTKIDKETLTKVSSVLVTNLMCQCISANVFTVTKLNEDIVILYQRFPENSKSINLLQIG